MKSRILIVEDEEFILEYLCTALRLNGYEVFRANNGQDGLEKALKEVPDMIISDIMMPKMDGYQMLEEIRKHPETAKIPVLLLTARIEKTDIRQGMNLGADDYLTKPFDMDDLFNAINSRLKKQEVIETIYKEKIEDIRQSIRSTLPHEIRTPLNIILGYSGMLLRKEDYSNTEEIKEMVSSIHYGAQRLNRLFENYLLYVNLEMLLRIPEEANKILSQKTISPESIIQEITSSLSEHKDRIKDIKLNLEDAVIVVSENYFNKIIRELLDNALKFSKAGKEIVITTKIENNKLKLNKILVTKLEHSFNLIELSVLFINDL